MVTLKEKEKVKKSVVAKAYLDPMFHQQFAQRPIEAILSAAETENVSIEEEDAESIAKDVKPVIAPFVGVEVKILVTDLTDRIKAGFESILMMSKVLFYLGISIIIVAFLMDVYGVLTGVNWQQYVASTGVLGALGLGTVYSSFVKGSFEKIKNSVGDLVQINVIFFGYADQLSLLMKQSQDASYEVSEKIVEKIGDVIMDTVKTIQKYCEVSPSED